MVYEVTALPVTKCPPLATTTNPLWLPDKSIVAVFKSVKVTDCGINWESLESYTEIITFFDSKLCVTTIVDWLSNDAVMVETSETSCTKVPLTMCPPFATTANPLCGPESVISTLSLSVRTTDVGISWEYALSYIETIMFRESKLWFIKILDVSWKDAVTVATWEISGVGKFDNWEPSPTKKEAVTSPNILREPVVWELVVTTCWIEGVPLSFSKKILPSKVLIANSPSSILLVFGTFPSTAVLFNLTTCCDIYMTYLFQFI